MRSRSILASVRVAISMPVVLSSNVLMVTNITASTSPAKDGNAPQGKACRAAVFHGKASEAAGCGWNIQPLAWAAPSDVPLSEQGEVHGRERCQQHAGECEWAFRAAQQHMQDDGDGRSCRELGAGHGIGEGAEIGERRMLVGDDLDGAGDHQPAGGAEEAADHRIGQKADGAPGMGEAQHAHQEPGQRRRQRHGDEGRREKIGVAAGGNPLQHRGDERGNDDGDRAVRSGDRERQRAAQRHKRAADGCGHERNRNAIGQKMRQRPAENERRVGQRVGDRQHAADRAGEYVRQSGAHAQMVLGLSNVLPVRPIISRPGRDLQHGLARG